MADFVVDNIHGYTMETPKNNYSKTLDELNYEELMRHIPLLTYLAVLCLSGIVGNTLVLHIFTTSYTLSTFRTFVIFLSAVDVFTCAIAIPLEMVTLIFEYKSDTEWLCKLYPFFLTWPTVTSVFLLLASAADRYRKVCTPFSWQFSYRVARNICISSASLSIGCSLISSVIFGVRQSKHSVYNITIFECEITETMGGTAFPLINNIMFAIIFVGAVTGSTILYCCIALRVKQQMKEKHQILCRRDNLRKTKNTPVASNKTAERQNHNKHCHAGEKYTFNKLLDSNKKIEEKQEEIELEAFIQDTTESKSNSLGRNQHTSSYRTTLIMFMVSSAFVVSYVPSLSILLIRALDKDFVESLNDVERSVYKFFIRSYLLNSVINPVIYGVFDSHFRKSCKIVYCCKYK